MNRTNINYSIEIIESNGRTWIIRINGTTLTLGKRLCHVDLGYVENVAYIIKCIEDIFMWRLTFKELREEINALNLLTFLDALYRRETIELFEFSYRKMLEETPCDSRPLGYGKFFFYMFGFNEHSKHCRVPLYSELKAIVANLYPQKLNEYFDYCYNRKKYYKYASNGTDVVEFIDNNKNYARFNINGKRIHICLSSRPYARDASVLLRYVEDLRIAFINKDVTDIHRITNDIGYKATLGIAKICYPDLTYNFLENIIDNKVAKRQQPFPQKTLNSFFRRPTDKESNEQSQFYDSLLSRLEKNLTKWNEALLNGNEIEVQSAKREWILYYAIEGTAAIHCAKVVFCGSENLMHECQEYCRTYSILGRKERDIRALYGQGITLSLAIRGLYNDLDFGFDSIKEIKKYHIQLLISHLVQNTNLSLNSIDKEVMALHQLYCFTTKVARDEKSSPFYGIKIGHIPKNPMRPLSQNAKKMIVERINEMPPAIQIATKIAFATSSRSGSLEELTVRSLVGHKGNYRIRIFYKKTFKYRIKNNLPSYSDYPIPDEFAYEILEFINTSAELRSQLDKPYLLVYRPTNWRVESCRLPMIVTARTVAFALNQILEEVGIKTEDGIQEIASLRSIRAEIGRTLFSQGKNANEVSRFLGNTPAVAKVHYDKSYPEDEAKNYNKLYKQTIETSAFSVNDKEAEQDRMLMFGICSANTVCDGKDCRNCRQRIVKKDVT